MATKLIRFKVTNFRSIEQSDWVSVGENSCLVGTNEAGKTNLLIALWKLKPANGEPIRPLEDFPRHLYSTYKVEGHEKDVFIEADFQLSQELASEISQKLSCDIGQCSVANVKRKFNGDYQTSLPYSKIEFYEREKFEKIFDDFSTKLSDFADFKKEESALQKQTTDFLASIEIKKDKIEKETLEKIKADIESFCKANFGRKVNLPTFFNRELLNKLQLTINAFEGQPLTITADIKTSIRKSIPKFVYYSDYGNLDSEIYLPRVIEDFKREDLSESARAKARTLDVLFRYVNLSPEEIYELGNDRKIIVKTVDSRTQQELSQEEENLTDSEIQEWADKKKERAVLLSSASSELTKSFRKWWLQGNYIFKFEADGHHFRINVSDDLRPEEIELEGRSRGLQWFFSFFLVFLVETKDELNNSVLLLDEPGLSLHPLAQFDLAKFFKNLATDNQLIYTSHSPFIVDMDNLANVKAVYTDKESGRTKISSNLRYNEAEAEKSVYPVHAALGLSVSETLLLGCSPILVEGPSDQIYLSLIKRHLIGKGKYQNSKELVFIPTGGVRGMGPVTKLVSSRDGSLPKVLLDSDKAGKEYKKVLAKGRYRDCKELILEVEDFLEKGEFEIEDLMPVSALIDIVDRTYHSKSYLDDVYKKDEPIVDQIEEWAEKNGIELVNGWKVEIARECLNRFERISNAVDAELEEKWANLFSKLIE